MTEDRKLNTRLDQQISSWFLKQEKLKAEEALAEGRRVSMECVAVPKKYEESV